MANVELPITNAALEVLLMENTGNAVSGALEVLQPLLKLNMPKDEITLLKRGLTVLKSNFRSRFVKCNKNKHLFRKRFESWLKTPVRIPQVCARGQGLVQPVAGVPPAALAAPATPVFPNEDTGFKSRTGRPSKPYELKSISAKYKYVKQIALRYSEEVLRKALVLKLKIGKRGSEARIVEDLAKHHGNVDRMKKEITLGRPAALKSKFSADKAGAGEEARSHFSWRQKKKLFTPGPLGVSQNVRNALTVDVGSRDATFINVIQTVRRRLVEIAGLSPETHSAVLMQGSGTFSVEAVLNSTSDRKKKVLLLVCGAYGKRMQLICERAGLPSHMIVFPENEPIRLDENVRSHLESGDYGSLALVHCETTSGLVNPIREVGEWLKAHDPSILYIVDAMSSFGGVEEDFQNVDFLISSANKCLQGVPGFAFVIANKKRLLETKGSSTSLSLDLFDQWTGLETNGQFRFTPPTHGILAFMEALRELDQEGGVPARAKRYKENNRIVKEGMTELGFRRFVADGSDGHIITSFQYPKHANFQFEEFYNRLSDKGQLIYPGKVTNADCFRIGNIGHLFPSDMHHLLQCIKEVLTDMKIPLPVQ